MQGEALMLGSVLWSWHVHAVHPSIFLGKMGTCRTGAIKNTEQIISHRADNISSPEPLLMSTLPEISISQVLGA